jgi:hypothetical protein
MMQKYEFDQRLGPRLHRGGIGTRCPDEVQRLRDELPLIRDVGDAPTPGYHH